MTTTPQELGRTATAHHHHDDPEAFCLACITNDLMFDGLRGQTALLAALELKYLATVRASITRYSWRDEWEDVLDVGALREDLASENAVRRMAARRGKEAVTDFLICRMALTHSFEVRVRLAPKLREIERRTRARLEAMKQEDELGELVSMVVH